MTLETGASLNTPHYKDLESHDHVVAPIFSTMEFYKELKSFVKLSLYNDGSLLFILVLYIPVNNFSVMFGMISSVEPVLSS